MSRAVDDDTQLTAIDGFEATDVAVALPRGPRSDTVSDLGETLDPDARLSRRAATDDDMLWPEGTLSGDDDVAVRRSTSAEIDAAFDAIGPRPSAILAVADDDVVELRDSAIVDTLDVEDTLDARDSATLDLRDPETDAHARPGLGFVDTATLEVPARGSQVRLYTSTDLCAVPTPPRVALPRRLPTEAGWAPPSRAPQPPRSVAPAGPAASRARRAAVFAAVLDEEPVTQADDDLV